MQRLFYISGLFLALTPAQAAEKWEICLDKADFTFSVDGFLGSTTVSKNQCMMNFAVSGGKGMKFEIDICDPTIQIKQYAEIDSVSSTRLVAGSAGCPKPLFGADFDENSHDTQDYLASRKKIFDLWESVKKVYGEGSDMVDLANPKSFSPEVSAGKIACAQYLLKEYLQRCTSFEAKKAPEPAPGSRKSNIPGVHNETILAPKTKEP